MLTRLRRFLYRFLITIGGWKTTIMRTLQWHVAMLLAHTPTLAKNILSWLFTTRKVTFLLLLVGILSGVLGYRYLHSGELDLARPLIEDFYANFSIDLMSLAITVFVIDSLNKNREKQILKEYLIRKMRSKQTLVALEAVEELRAYGWLIDGSLRRTNLRGANLKRANLRDADLRGVDLALANLRGAYLVGADLWGANLDKAFLTGANLTGANVDDGQLALAYTLAVANLPDGSLYNGRFRLEGDIRSALQSNIDIDDPAAMATHYSVLLDEDTRDPKLAKRAEHYKISVENYQQGQEWADKYLHKVKEDIREVLEFWGHDLSQGYEEDYFTFFVDLDDLE